MAFYPVMFDLQGKECLVIGGGRIAIRKVIGLIRAGASVKVVAVSFNRHFRNLGKYITIHERQFSEEDIKPGIALVIGATNDNNLNKLISEICALYGIPCNIVDCPELCSFIVPAVVRRGDLTIAVSTGGTSPRFSRYIKQQLAELYGPEYKQFTEYLAEVRRRVQKEFVSQSVRFSFWEALFATDPSRYIKLHGWNEFRLRVELLIDDFKQRKS